MNIRILIIISFFATLVSDVSYYVYVAMKINFSYTPIIITCKIISFICLITLGIKLKWKNQFPVWANVFFRLMMLWSIISIVRGIFLAESYWDWKYLFLNTTFAFLVPYAIIAGALYEYCNDLFRLIVTKLFLFGFLLIPLTVPFDLQRELFPRGLMMSSSFFVLTIPYLKPKWKLVVICVAVTGVFIALDFRSNIIRTCFSSLLVIAYFARKLINGNVLKMVCLVCLVCPLVLLALGLKGTYNVFKPSDDYEKYSIEYNNGLESNLSEDTRTFLYEEVLISMRNNDSFLFGESATGKYKTAYFEDDGGVSGKRYGSEVGFLNTLLYSGLIGVVLYGLVLFAAVYYGMKFSNNFFCKMLALFLAFKWVMFFIEDFIQYDVNFYVLWLSIGLCLSKGFRAMSDAEIRAYFDFSARKKIAGQLL